MIDFAVVRFLGSKGHNHFARTSDFSSLLKRKGFELFDMSAWDGRLLQSGGGARKKRLEASLIKALREKIISIYLIRGK